MNNALRHVLIGSLLIAAQSMTLSAFAAQGPKAPEGYVGDGSGVVVTDGYGNCVETGFPPPPGTKCMEPAAPAPVAAAPAPAPAPAMAPETLVLSAETLFDYDKADLRPAGKAKLDTVAAKVKGGAKVTEINVTGHTDSRGSNSYNQKLSERRAASVKTYLVSQGVDGSIIHTRGMGETAPVASNKTAEGRQQNRRVEVEIK